MADASVVAYNIAVFVATLFLLEFGADKFIDHTAIVARRTGLSETVIGLVTAGGEWEELAVIVASLARGRSSLAIGNVVGSAISNILGAFSLGLLFRGNGGTLQFDRSSRIFSVLLLVMTTLVVPLAYFPERITWLVCGPVLITTFAVYLLVVGLAIARGILTAPKDSDSDSDSGSDSDSDSDSNSGDHRRFNTRSIADETTPILSAPIVNQGPLAAGNEATHRDAARAEQTRSPRPRHGIAYHCGHLALGFLAICLAGYILSQAAANITDQLGGSDVLFGVVVLAVATTLPEKFVAVMSGHRGHPGILVANCAGSNIFLLSLCVGIIMVDTRGSLDGGNVTVTELVVLWASTLALTLTVWFGARLSRWIGVAMLAGYLAFIMLEFTVVHRVAD